MIYILTGEIESGKSSALLRWLDGRNYVYGILSPRKNDGERYFLNVNTREEFRMEAGPGEDNTIEVGRYRFLDSAFSRANQILGTVAGKVGKGYIIIDEVGKLELRSEGLDGSVRTVLEHVGINKDLDVIIVVRMSLLKEILEYYSIENYHIISKDLLP